MTARVASPTTFEGVEVLDAALSRVALGVGVLQLGMAEGLEALGQCGGHHELGFASLEAYGLERCERSARWVQGTRVLARRVAGLPALRRALIAGEVGVCMAQVIAGVACENPLSPAGPPAAPEGQISADEEERVTLTVTVDREAGWLFEAARMLSKQMGDRTLEETLEALLAEGSSSLWAEMDRESIVPFDEALDERAAQRAWESELSRFREEAEARCERRIGERPRARASDVAGVELTWQGTAERMDAQLRWVAAELVRRDLVLGELAEAFWTADGWRRLGYATESQYARERLGMSLSSVKAKRALARRARVLPRLREAVDARELGYEAARLVASVASPETADAWVERARERTVKHLREETDVAEMLGRIGVDAAMTPPSEATMKKLAALERRVVSGAALQSDESQIFASDGDTLQSDESQIFAGDERAQHELRVRGHDDLRARGRLTLKFRVSAGTQRCYRWLERLYLRHGPREGSFFRYLCLSFIAVWRESSGVEPAYARVYARDLYRCTNPVCSRRDVTPHHLVFRSAGGDDSDENVASLCMWCHLEGVHGGKLRVEPPASAMQWRIGRSGHTVVRGRARMRNAEM